MQLNQGGIIESRRQFQEWQSSRLHLFWWYDDYSMIVQEGKHATLLSLRKCITVVEPVCALPGCPDAVDNIFFFFIVIVKILIVNIHF